MVFDFRGNKVCRYREFHRRDAALRVLDSEGNDH
jgi:hypothetical protein